MDSFYPQMGQRIYPINFRDSTFSLKIRTPCGTLFKVTTVKVEATKSSPGARYGQFPPTGSRVLVSSLQGSRSITELRLCHIEDTGLYIFSHLLFIRELCVCLPPDAIESRNLEEMVVFTSFPKLR